MTAVSRDSRSAGPQLRPQDLPALVGVPLSDEQIRAATAPLEPQLVVAGAGTGKTTVMAARVTWLVATGQVSAGAVLGLTFTNKAAGELRSRIHRALGRVHARHSESGRGPGSGSGASSGGGPDSSASASAPASDPFGASVMTYHSFSGQVLSEFGLLIGVEPGPKPLTDGLRARLAHRVAVAPAADTGNLAKLAGSGPTTLATQILSLDDALADLDVTTDELRDFDASLLAIIAEGSGAAKLIERVADAATGRTTLATLVDEFRDLKRVEGLQDFADQVRFGSLLAHRVGSVASALRERYAVVLLDEYQDTSRSQRRTMQALFGEGHPVTAVGDPCQAIYGWRGASSTNIDEFPEHFRTMAGAPAESYPLTVNRRSTRAVLDVANYISRALRDVHVGAAELSPPPHADAGSLSCALFETADEEVSWLTDQIEKLCAERDPGDIAVLCRTNTQVSQIAATLRDRGVPVQIWAKQGLFEMAPVREVLGLLRVCADPLENAELVSHLVGPRCRVGPVDLAILRQRSRQLARVRFGAPAGGADADGADSAGGTDTDGADPAPVEESLVDAIFSPGTGAYSAEARRRFVEVAWLLAHLMEHRGRPVWELVDLTVDQLGMQSMWGDDPLGRADAAAMAEFQDFVHEFEDLDGGRALLDFLAYVDDCQQFKASPDVELPTSEGRVSVLTIHGSKGLEFPVVALPFLSEKVFPAAQGRSRWPTSATVVPQVIAGEPDPAAMVGFPDGGISTKSHKHFVDTAQAFEVLDEDRLAYVAVTRAEEAVIASGHWWGPTQSRPRGPSKYLEALKSVAKSAAVWQSAPEDDAISPSLTSPATAVIWPSPTVSASAKYVADLVGGRTGDEPPFVGADEAAEGAGALDPTTWVDRVQEVVREATEMAKVVPVPAVMSVSDVIAWQSDPKGFAARLMRPMPRISSEAAAAGTAFHEWVEQRLGQQSLFEPDGAGGFTDVLEPKFDKNLAEMFARTPFADRAPVAVERAFTLNLGHLTITGKIDAVFKAGDRFEVVDWKTGSRGSNPQQLALYRLAWSQIAGVPLADISAAFVYLATGDVRWHENLPDLSDLGSGERIVSLE